MNTARISRTVVLKLDQVENVTECKQPSRSPSVSFLDVVSANLLVQLWLPFHHFQRMSLPYVSVTPQADTA